MFDKIGQCAENMAMRVSVSRRGFLGRLGQSALVAWGGHAFGQQYLIFQAEATGGMSRKVLFAACSNDQVSSSRLGVWG